MKTTHVVTLVRLQGGPLHGQAVDLPPEHDDEELLYICPLRYFSDGTDRPGDLQHEYRRDGTMYRYVHTRRRLETTESLA